ncbi:MAG: serine/threonine-protein kinase [Bryobacteraceae bacterium]|nr:serine/threonine-protein kinase [Bryobacteraceae bacterium]
MAASQTWSRISAAVSAALDAPRREWSRILREWLGQGSLAAEARKYLAKENQFDQVHEGPPREPALAEGARLADRYEVRRFLGQGSMGEVYEALDELMGQSVALKRLLPGLGGPTLARELRLGRKVRHRNVCQLFDISPGPEVAFLTMELLQGESLQDRLARGPMEEDEANAILRQILEGLQAIHEAGVLHGDLKASNVFLDRERVVIMDFGLSRRMHTSEVSVFGPNVIAGTPAYMAPEQIRGEALTASADLHAAGALWFYMVTGQLPFGGGTAQETMIRRLEGRAPAVADVRAGLSAKTRRGIAWCMEAAPGDRPASASELMAVLDGERRIPWRFSRRQAGAMAGGALLTAAAGAAVTWGPRKKVESPEVQRLIAAGEEFLSRRGPGDLEKAVEDFRRALALNPESEEAWCGLGEAYSQMANWGTMEPGRALAEARRAAERAAALAADNAKAVGLGAYLTSIDVRRWLTADGEFARALKLDGENAHVRFWYASHLGRTARHGQAIEQLKSALEKSPRNLSLSYLHQLAVEYFRSGRNHEQLTQARELLRVQSTLGHTYVTLARAYLQLGQMEEARKATKEAELYKADRAQLLGVLPAVELWSGNERAARKLAEEFDAMHRVRAVERVKLASVWALLGEAERAVTVLEEGLERRDPSILSAHVTPWMYPIREHAGYVRFVRATGWTGPVGPRVGSSRG